MGNSKHSTVSTTSVSLNEHKQFQQFQVQRRTTSQNNGYAGKEDVQLGRLRSVDFRLGKVLFQSGALSSARTDGLLLDKLWTPNTFLFSRTSEKNHGGFGFSCDITFNVEDDDEDGRLIVRQMVKPKKGFQGSEDSALDVYDITPQLQRQILGLVLKKHQTDQRSKTSPLEGLDVLSVQGLVGHVTIKGDWTTAYEISNVEGEASFVAQRFNRISGGIEFQIYSVSEVELAVCIATLVRLEESKFILKIYAPSPPVLKSLMISFTIFLMYLLSR